MLIIFSLDYETVAVDGFKYVLIFRLLDVMFLTSYTNQSSPEYHAFSALITPLVSWLFFYFISVISGTIEIRLRKYKNLFLSLSYLLVLSQLCGRLNCH